MNLSHEQARRLVERALDGPLSPKADLALGQHLANCADCHQYAAQLDQTHARLSQALQQRWPAQPLDDTRMAKLLHTTRTHVRRNAMQTRVNQIVRPLAWGLPMLALLLLLNWSIRSLRTNPAATQPAETATVSAPIIEATGVTPETSATPVATAVVTAVVTPQPTPVAPLPAAALVPGDNFRLQAELPQAPQQVTLYQQVLPAPVQVEQAQQLAQDLGVQDGGVDVPDLTGLVPPEGGFPVSDSYAVTNGEASAYVGPFAGMANYQASKGIAYPPGQNPALPEAERIARAEAFLKQAGVLPPDYLAMLSPYDDRLVAFVPRFQGLPVYTGIGEPRWDWTTVQVDQQGVQVANVQGFEVKPVGTTPIISAKQAWQRLLSSPTWQKARYAVINPANANTARKWVPSYPLGETLELYGYVHHTQTRSGERWITFSDYARVEVPDPQLYNLQQESSVHLWGQFRQDEHGRLWLKIDRWEPVDVDYNQHIGRLVRQGGQSLIETSQGTYSLVPNVSELLADGTLLDISGFPIKGDSVQWWRMESGPFGSNYRAMLSCTGNNVRGGLSGPLGSFGGGKLYFAQAPVLAPVPEDAFKAAYPTGTPLAGKSGQVNATIYRRSDGDQVTLALKIDPEPGFPGGLIWLAEGALDGLEAYHGLPVHIWGQVIGQQDGWPALRVERFMPKYPGVTPQRFVGKRSAGLYGGQMMAELTTEDGQQQHYWLRSGLDHWTNDMLDEILAVGEDKLVEIEGFIIPDRTHGGLPVLYDIASEYPADPTTTALQPPVVDQTGNPASTVTFTRVELAYLTAHWQNCTQGSPADPRQAANLLLQPVWIFHGQLADGRIIEVQVQALPDELLK